MATRKAGGSAKNLKDSNPKYLGVKLFDGQLASPGAVLVRQRGTRFIPGRNVFIGKDHTLHAKNEGVVKFKDKRKTSWRGDTRKVKMVEVLPQS